LETIPVPKRTLRVWKQLATVYDHFGEIKSAIDCYKSILKLEPFSFECVISLLDYGVSFKEIRPLLIDDSVVSKFANAYYSSLNNSYSVALQTFTALGQQYKGNPFLLAHTAQTYQRSGDIHTCQQIFTKIRRLDPDAIEGLDTFAFILRQQGNFTLVHRLANELMDLCDRRPEAWVSKAILHEMKSEHDEAMKHIEKAISLDKRHYFSHQIKGKVLFNMRRFGEAGASFRNAYGITRDIVTYEGLVHCYISLGKLLEATSTAKEALALLPNSPRAVCLAGVVMTHNPSLLTKARDYFDKALKMDPKSLETLYALSDLHVQRGNTQKAIDLYRFVLL
jgi:tetratricopeptide (TPR) repeat protein